MVHSFFVIILYFPVSLSIYGALVMCHHFIFSCQVVYLWCTRYVSSFYIFPVRLSIYGALVMCHHFIFFLSGCLSMVHSLCVIILYFPVRLSIYGALVMCHNFIFSCQVVYLWCTRYVSSFYIFLLGCLTMVHSLCVNVLCLFC